MQYADALALLDRRGGYERTGRVASPSLERIEQVLALMGDPQHACPVVHVTGTNGKGSTAQMITRLLMAHGLRVATYTSPHLERVNERLAIDSVPIGDADFADELAAVTDLEVMAGTDLSYFELLTAMALRWFADEAVDVAVIEVGMLGRWDATNVVDAKVAVVTNVALDHTEYAGPTRADIAREKAGIAKPGSSLVIGETDAELVDIFRAAGARRWYRRVDDFDCVDNRLAVGGRLLDLRTPSSLYRDVYLPLAGRHQGDNAAAALMAVEAFFEAPVAADVVEEGLGSVVMPGRFEVLGHQPLVVVDGAHNPAGADTCAQVFFDDVDPAGRRLLVVGCLAGRDPEALLAALRVDEFDMVVCATAPSARGLPAAQLVAAARRLGCDHVVESTTPEAACDVVLADAGPDDAVLVAGSLYTVGAARPHLIRRLP